MTGLKTRFVNVWRGLQGRGGACGVINEAWLFETVLDSQMLQQELNG